MSLHGVFPMLVTPFDDAGDVRLDDLEPLVEAMLAAGAQGISALGLGGEVSLLSESERIAVTDRVLDVVGGMLPVIVGATADETRASCRFAERAASAGAEVVMVAPPSNAGPDRDDLTRHYLAVADAIAPVALMVQDAPAFIGVALDAPFIVELGRLRANIRYAKTEAMPAGEAVHALRDARAQGAAIFGGQAGLQAIDVMDAGAVGLIPGCEVAADLVALMNAYTAGDREQAVVIHRRLLPLLNCMFQGLDCYIQSTKFLLWRRGLITSPVTRTGAELGQWSRAALERYATEAGAP